MESINKIQLLEENKFVVDNHIQQMLLQLKIEKPKPINLKGIWENKGFEKITDLDFEIKQIRTELNESTLKRVE